MGHPDVYAHLDGYFMEPPTYEHSSSIARSAAAALPAHLDAPESSATREALRDALRGDDAAVALPPALLNLVPRPGEVSFQRGYLGYTAATLQGTLQIKFIDSASEYRRQLDRVEVEFVGTEKVNGSIDDEDDDAAGTSSTNTEPDRIELVYSQKVLWKNDAETDACTSQGTGTSSSSSRSGPPGTMDFEFGLTNDLPHCCHVGS